MNRKTVRIIAIIIAAVMIIGVMALGISYVFAANEQSRIDESNKKVNEQQNKINQIRGEQELTAENIENLKRETVIIQSAIDEQNAKIAATEEELQKAEEDLAKAKEKSDNQYAAYKERFRIMCEEGSVSYLELIFSSESFMDFLDKIEIAREISEYDNKIYTEMKKAEEEIRKLTEEIAAKKNAQEEEKAVLDKQKDELDSKLAELEEVKKRLQNDEAAAQAIIDEEIRKQNELKAQMARTLSMSGDGSVYAGGDFLWPTPSCTYVTSHFAPLRVNPVTGQLRPHTGTDIGAQYGADIIAAAAGTVKYAGWNGGYGNCVIIDHGGGRSTLYSHMSSIGVSLGQTVSAGQSVGKVGATGNVTGPHLHFEVLINGTAVDAMQFF